LVLLAPVAVLAYDPGSAVFDAGGGGGASIGDGVTSGTGDVLSSFDYDNPALLTGDVAPVSRYGALGGGASPFAVTAASQVGANSTWRGGCGTTNIKCVSAAGVVDDTTTVTLSGYTSAGAAWTQTFAADATDDDATDWVPGATEATCATNLAAVIDAGTVSGLYVDAATGGVGAAFVGIQLKPGANAGCPTIATNAAVGVLLPVNGADGGVGFQDGTAAAPSITFSGDSDTGIFRSAANTLSITYNGIQRWTFATIGAYDVMHTPSTTPGFGNGGSAYIILPNAGVVQGGPGTGSRLNLATSGVALITGSTSTTPALAYSYPKEVIVADDGAGTHAAMTLNLADSNHITATCNDATGCTATITETSAANAMPVRIVCAGTGAHTDFADSAGVLELVGGAAFECAPMMSMTVYHNGTAWVEASRTGAF
jgi:hypothetical protein